MVISATKNMSVIDGRCLLSVLLLLVWAVAFAQPDSEQTEMSAKYVDELIEEIVVSAEEEWRKLPEDDHQWRQPELKPKTKMELGYDSVYEELRAREGNADKQFDFQDPQTTSLFRLRF